MSPPDGERFSVGARGAVGWADEVIFGKKGLQTGHGCEAFNKKGQRGGKATAVPAPTKPNLVA